MFEGNARSGFHTEWEPQPGFYESTFRVPQADYPPATIRRLKCHLLSHGLAVGPQTVCTLRSEAKFPQQVRSGASSGLDLILPGDVWVNAPFASPETESRAPVLWNGPDGYSIRFGDEAVQTLVLPRPRYYSRHTSTGVPMNLIGQMCGDRIGFGITNTCFFWSKERRCAFCSIGNNKSNEIPEKPLSLVLETLDAAVRDPVFPARHVLLSGGTPADADWGVEMFAEYCKAIKERFDLRVYLMTVPPPDLGMLEILYEAGVDEIALNIEIYDPAVAARLVPGKHNLIGRRKYLDALDLGVKLWGYPNVRSLLVAGCEPMESTLEGVRTIVETGAMPILSAFRPLPGSNMTSFQVAGPEWSEELWMRAETIATQAGVSLGPACHACRNNVLA